MRRPTSGLRKPPWPASTTLTNVHDTPASLSACGQPLRLVERDERVLGPVEDQERRVVAGDVRDRRGRPRRVLVLLEGAADQLRLGRVGCVVIHAAGIVPHRQQVAGPELVHDALHPAADAPVRPDVPLQVRDAAAGTEHGGEVAAGRGADHADAIGVEPVLRRVGPDPSDRRLAVVDLGRPGRLAAQPVVDRGRGIIAALHEVGDLAQPHRLVARPERPAVDVHDHRQRLAGPGRPGQEQVERLARILRAGVGDVLLDPDALRQRRLGVARRLLGEPPGSPRE